MAVSLYTVRIVLHTLGAEDYGIYTLIAGIISIFSFISAAMASASQRFFAIAMGEGDRQKVVLHILILFHNHYHLQVIF